MIRPYREQDAAAMRRCIADLQEAERRRGVGAQLLREAERLAVAAGAQEIRVGVLDENHSATRLYRRAGFAPYLQTMAKRLNAAQLPK